jgi:hypothetical protein
MHSLSYKHWKFKRTRSCLKGMTKLLLLHGAFASILFSPLFFSFFFFFLFSNYLKNAISFVNQITRYRYYPSHKMIPINYGVITVPTICQKGSLISLRLMPNALENNSQQNSHPERMLKGLATCLFDNKFVT